MTWRELSWMADGREEAAWAHTSHLMALVASACGNDVKASDFNPYAARREANRKPPQMKLREIMKLVTPA